MPSSSNQIARVSSGTAYTDNDLAASTTYYYKVEAVDSEGSSAASAQASATTQAGSGGFGCHVTYTISSEDFRFLQKLKSRTVGRYVLSITFFAA